MLGVTSGGGRGAESAPLPVRRLPAPASTCPPSRAPTSAVSFSAWTKDWKSLNSLFVVLIVSTRASLRLAGSLSSSDDASDGAVRMAGTEAGFEATGCESAAAGGEGTVARLIAASGVARGTGAGEGGRATADVSVVRPAFGDGPTSCRGALGASDDATEGSVLEVLPVVRGRGSSRPDAAFFRPSVFCDVNSSALGLRLFSFFPPA